MTPESNLKRIRLDLARSPDFPNGSHDRGYEVIAPIDDQGHIMPDVWKRLRDRCRVRRFWAGSPDEFGHLVRKPGGSWAFHYDIHGPENNDESGYRFDQHVFKPAEYISIREHDGVLRTFFVRSVVEVD